MARDLSSATDLLNEEAPDIVALDLGVVAPGHPEMADFLSICKAQAPAVPTLAIIPSPDPEPYAATQDIDDFLFPPYRSAEVVMRINHLLRRSSPLSEASVIRVGPLTIDLARYEVLLESRRLELTFKEYELLRFLGSSPGKVFTRETLLNRVWGYEYFGGTRTVDVHIRRLRSKIETTTNTFIDTVKKVGYRFREQ